MWWSASPTWTTFWYEYTIGQAQNHADPTTTSIRCWVSRRYTLTAAKKIAMAEQKTSRGTNATGISHSSPKSGRQWRATKKMTMTHDWKKKNTEAEPTAASARISRGNETFLRSEERRVGKEGRSR